ncbi:MAG: hypothetical protein E6Q36_00170 [Chryseobacterium sp.]|nr:MAG: hypothetical protein E6Q36_00170 [Chryseobacterium sp.]
MTSAENEQNLTNLLDEVFNESFQDAYQKGDDTMIAAQKRAIKTVTDIESLPPREAYFIFCYRYRLLTDKQRQQLLDRMATDVTWAYNLLSVFPLLTRRQRQPFVNTIATNAEQSLVTFHYHFKMFTKAQRQQLLNAIATNAGASYQNWRDNYNLLTEAQRKQMVCATATDIHWAYFCTRHRNLLPPKHMRILIDAIAPHASLASLVLQDQAGLSPAQIRQLEKAVIRNGI